MEIDTDEGQLQVHLYTKQTQYAVPDTPFAIGGKVTQTELNSFVNALIRENVESNEPIQFEFLIENEFLRDTLFEHLKAKSASTENVVNIEYVEQFPVPEPQNCLLHDDWVSAVKTHGKWILTGCYDNSVNVWEVSGRHTLTIHAAHTAPVKDVKWISVCNKTALFASASQDQTAKIWEWNIESNTADCLIVFKGHERGVDALDTISSTQLLATGSWDAMVKIWSYDVVSEGLTNKKMKGTQTKTPTTTLSGHKEAVSAVQFIDDKSLLTASWDHTIKIWDLSLGGIKSDIGGNKPFFDANISNLNGLIVAASSCKNISIYDLRTTSETNSKTTFLGHSQWVNSVCWSPSEEFHFLSGSYDNYVKLWDIRSPKAPLFDLIGHEDKVHDCDMSPLYMVSGGADNTVRIYKTKKNL